MRAPQVTDLLLPEGRRLRVRSWPGPGGRWSCCTACSTPPRGGPNSQPEPTGRASRSTCRASAAPTCPRDRGSPPMPAPCRKACEQLASPTAALVGHSLGGAVATARGRAKCGGQLATLLAPAGFGAIRLADAFSLPVVNGLAALALPFALTSPLLVTAAYSAFVTHRPPSATRAGRPPARHGLPATPGVRSAVLGDRPRRSQRGGLPSARGALRRAGRCAVGRARPARAARTSPACGERCPQAHVEVWEGMGHHPQRERPAELARFVELRACAHGARTAAGDPTPAWRATHPRASAAAPAR